jgi:hypothetical protein
MNRDRCDDFDEIQNLDCFLHINENNIASKSKINNNINESNIAIATALISAR